MPHAKELSWVEREVIETLYAEIRALEKKREDYIFEVKEQHTVPTERLSLNKLDLLNDIYLAVAHLPKPVMVDNVISFLAAYYPESRDLVKGTVWEQISAGNIIVGDRLELTLNEEIYSE